MAKLLNTTFLVTQSAPATPSSGYGTLYASGSVVFFKNDNGVNYNLTLAGSSSISVFTNSGTWQKPPNVKYIKVVCVGGGGGGGAGRRSLVSSPTTSGGGGGGGGSLCVAFFDSSSLTTSSYTINVGSGGPGALGRTTVADGTAGVNGANSSFVSGSTSLVVAAGGAAGNGGRTSTNQGITPSVVAVLFSAGVNSTPSPATIPNPFPPHYIIGQNGGNGSQNTPFTIIPSFGWNNTNGLRSLAGGGGGGGVLTGASGSGGSGSAIYNYTTLIQSGSPGTTTGTINGENGAPIFDAIQLLQYSGSNLITGISIGTGGHGGAGGATSGTGGSGSLGAGGGGGGGNLSTGTAGRGGPGGDGFVLIFEYY
jgi:hypothetical protein